MIASIIRCHTAIYYIMSITRDWFRPYWVSSGRCKKTLNNKHAKKTNLPLSAKKRCNTKQYDTAIPISWGSHSRTHTHGMDNKSHRYALIGKQNHCQDLSFLKKHELLVVNFFIRFLNSDTFSIYWLLFAFAFYHFWYVFSFKTRILRV